ncbi:MAG: DUF1697 domain-containing protein [Nitrospinae bacterium]|nr:DUF1697 domain-containing protein [Nitrospinota bacterium]
MPATYIALLRAVNAGGANTLPSKEFVRLLEGLGILNVRTYIQTGNAVFQADEKDPAKLAAKIKAAINKKLGFAPEVILLKSGDLEKAVNSNPFPEAAEDHKSLHLFFLSSAPKSPDIPAIEKCLAQNERFSLKGRVFYFHAPDGVGRSKAFGKVEKSLGVPCTARNWRTARALLAMALE